MVSPHAATDAGDGLDALRARVAHDLACLSYPAKAWVRPHALGAAVLDCAIVGGGQYGQSLAFGLQRERIDQVVVFDANDAGFAGPWMTFARMIMLRTPKDLTGPDLGIGSLTFRAFYEAQHGADGWERLFRIQRPDWQAYLNWHREATGITVRPASRVTAIDVRPDGLFSLTVHDPDGARSWLARTVVLATGAEGSGGRVVPDFIRQSLPADRYAHTNDAIDFTRLKGQRIGVLGAGASSFDNACAALDAGATCAELSFRRAQLPLANPRRWMETAGFLAHYPELPDLQRWRYMKRLVDLSQPPPEPTFRRAIESPGFALRPATPWLDVRPHGSGVAVQTPSGPLQYDFVIVGTGITVDLALRPELRTLAPHIALWGDRFAPPAGEADERLARFPYLDRHGGFIEKTPGSAPWASRLFAIFRGATLSLGPSAASNSNIRYTAPRIVSGVSRALFMADADRAFDEFMALDHHELQPATVAAAVRG